MTLMEQIITIAICIVCVQFTRLLPFWIFPANRPIPEYVRYLAKYYLRDVWDVSGVLL